jgi:hypothetical protein
MAVIPVSLHSIATLVQIAQPLIAAHLRDAFLARIAWS